MLLIGWETKNFENDKNLWVKKKKLITPLSPAPHLCLSQHNLIYCSCTAMFLQCDPHQAMVVLHCDHTNRRYVTSWHNINGHGILIFCGIIKGLWQHFYNLLWPWSEVWINMCQHTAQILFPNYICDHREVITAWKKDMCSTYDCYIYEHGLQRRRADLNLSSL